MCVGAMPDCCDAASSSANRQHLFGNATNGYGLYIGNLVKGVCLSYVLILPDEEQ